MPLKLMKGIRHFKKKEFPEKKDLFDALTGGQYPEILFITCSDSRIIPSLITHAELGDLFVIRNAGNIIPPYSLHPSGEAATIEYALEVVNVKEIIICGHSHCGAMKGLLTPDLEKKLPTVAAWLSSYAPTLERIKEKYPNQLEEPSLLSTTKENLLLQVEHLKTHPAVKKKLACKQLIIHAWLYEFETGEIYMYDSFLDDFIPFEEAVTKIFNGDYVLTKMNALVEKEAMDYLTGLTLPQTAEEYKQQIELLNQLEKGIHPIWELIKATVQTKLWIEFGELCENEADSRFITLLQRGLEIELKDLKCLQKNLMKSEGYQKFYNDVMRNRFMTPAYPENPNQLETHPQLTPM